MHAQEKNILAAHKFHTTSYTRILRADDAFGASARLAFKDLASRRKELCNKYFETRTCVYKLQQPKMKQQQLKKIKNGKENVIKSKM